MYLLGTHGTSRTRAETIVATRCFRPTGDDGHVGSGIYFWAYVNNIRLAKHLAECWWEGYKRRGAYVGDADESCAVVDVTIKDPGAPSFLDATNEVFREALAEMAQSLDGTEDFCFKKATNLLFKKLESKSGIPILVAKVSLGSSNQAKRLRSIVVRDFPMSPAYVIRNGGEYLIEEYRIAA